MTGISINDLEKEVFNKRNTRVQQVFEKIITYSDNQQKLVIKVFEGEENLLGNFKITGIPLAASGVARINVYFRFDRNCILNVTATYGVEEMGLVWNITNITIYYLKKLYKTL